MSTFTALTTLNGLVQATALGEAMERLDPPPKGVGVFELEDGSGLWEVGGYFTEVPDAVALALLAAAFDAVPFAVSELPETDWVSKVNRELAPVQAGRFFVYGSHDAEKVPSDATALLIEAAMAFGTGHHGTTLGCLRALDRLLDQGFMAEKVGDIGCGTAVLAMAAASIWQGEILASDIDLVAVEVAEANLAANGLSGRVTCVEAAGFDHPALAAAAPYDLIFANILKGPLIDLAQDFAAHIRLGGKLILSGLLVTQVQDILTQYEKYDLILEYREDIEEWSALTLQKRG